jgi:hypothetical protein
MAIHHLVIAGKPAITLNVFFEPAHLYRRSIFDFVRIKREDLFEVVVFTQQRVPQRPKQNKNTRVSRRDGTTSAASSLPLSCLLKKDGRKAFRLCEIKKRIKAKM